ncbi:MAG: DUF4837 family protein [Bacteroidales bacterium]|jgi:hypothetical protein|nr:DUF4837 family protein [Bacteroidales bacterium]
MKKIAYLLIPFLIIFESCKDKDPSQSLPNVTGKAGEVVLVIDNEYWNAEIGQEFKKRFLVSCPVLPQDEPMFDLAQIAHNEFSKIFRTHRTLVSVKIDNSYTNPKIFIQENVWAKPQLIINVVAPDEAGLLKVVKAKGDLIIQRILEKEMNRYAQGYQKFEEAGIGNRLEEKFGYRLTVPKGYSLDLDTTDFVWIESRGHGDLIQGILVYSYPIPEIDLSTGLIFAKRDQFTQQFVPGPSRNSYMAVDRNADFLRKEINVNGINVIQTRGLWYVKNDFMGGPFVTFSVIDQNKKRVINFDGFVYAPQFDKRDYLRQVEAILYTLQKPKKQENESNH